MISLAYRRYLSLCLWCIQSSLHLSSCAELVADSQVVSHFICFHLPALAFKALMDFWKAGWLKATSWARSSKITWCTCNDAIWYNNLQYDTIRQYDHESKKTCKMKSKWSIAILKKMKSDAMPGELRQRQRSCSLPSRLSAFERRQCKPVFWSIEFIEKYWLIFTRNAK